MYEVKQYRVGGDDEHGMVLDKDNNNILKLAAIEDYGNSTGSARMMPFVTKAMAHKIVNALNLVDALALAGCRTPSTGNLGKTFTAARVG